MIILKMVITKRVLPVKVPSVMVLSVKVLTVLVLLLNSAYTQQHLENTPNQNKTAELSLKVQQQLLGETWRN